MVLAVAGERVAVPVGDPGLEVHPGELCHQVTFGGPDVAEVARAVRDGAVRVPSVVVGLPCWVVMSYVSKPAWVCPTWKGTAA